MIIIHTYAGLNSRRTKDQNSHTRATSEAQKVLNLKNKDYIYLYLETPSGRS